MTGKLNLYFAFNDEKELRTFILRVDKKVLKSLS